MGSLGAVLLVEARLARAQQPPKLSVQRAAVPRVGYLTPGSPRPNSEGFELGLRDSGFVNGESITIEYRAAEGKGERVSSLAQELAALRVEVIFAVSSAALIAARKVTSTIPTVGIDLESDPVASGFVKSLSRPGGNVTGIFLDLPEMAGKLLQLLQETLPRLQKVGILWQTPYGDVQFRATRTAAQKVGLAIRSLPVGGSDDLESAVNAAAGEKVGALVVLSSSMIFFNRVRIADLALRNRLPAISLFTSFPEAGLLLAYGPNLLDMFRRSGQYVARVLRGTRPAEMPIERPTKFDFVINFKTAKALGLTIPRSHLQRADQVIE